MPNSTHSTNIVHVIESFGAGTLQIVKALANFQAKNGHSVTVFHGNRAETPLNYKELFNQNITLIPLKTGRSINGILDVIDILRVAHFARRNKTDIIHGHSSKGGVIARVASLLSEAKSLYSPHGFSFMAEGGVDVSRKTFTIEKILAKLPGEITCCSRSEQDAAKLLSSRNSCIENFVDVEEIDAKILPFNVEKTIDVITVGRISDQKNPALFFEIARRFPAYTFVWVGGPVEVSGAEHPKNVRITGWITRDEVIGYYAKARVYLATSRYEGMPIVMLEAMAAGLPIVSTDVPGSKDVVQNGTTGYLCENVDILSLQLQTLLSDVEMHMRLSKAAREATRKRYDRGVVLEKWQQKYSDTIQASKSVCPSKQI